MYLYFYNINLIFLIIVCLYAHTTPYVFYEEHHPIIANLVGIVIDLSKALDTISHDKLLHKLNNHGIRDNVLQLIKSYLSNRSQYVSALGENSDKLPVKFGVRQSPLLFTDYTNIFVADECKNTVYETANKVLEFVYMYMKCNILYINF